MKKKSKKNHQRTLNALTKTDGDLRPAFNAHIDQLESRSAENQSPTRKDYFLFNNTNSSTTRGRVPKQPYQRNRQAQVQIY